jgi:hypothetical protein
MFYYFEDFKKTELHQALPLILVALFLTYVYLKRWAMTIEKTAYNTRLAKKPKFD